MAEITLNEVWKRYPDGFEAVKNVNLEIGDGEFMILVGPSGCGKSTALRMIAGLEDITEGDLIIGGDRVNDLAPKGSRHRDGVSELRAVSAHDGARQHGLRLEAVQGGQGHDRSEGDRRGQDPGSGAATWSASRPTCPAVSVSGWRWAARSCRPPGVPDGRAATRTWTPSCACRSHRGRRGSSGGWAPHGLYGARPDQAMTLGDRVAVIAPASCSRSTRRPTCMRTRSTCSWPASSARRRWTSSRPHRGDTVQHALRGGAPARQGQGRTEAGQGGPPRRDRGHAPRALRGRTSTPAALPSPMKFRVKADVVESMGSEKFVYFDVKAQEFHTAELNELAADAGMEDLPSHGDGRRSSPGCRPRAPSRPATTSSWSSTPARSSCSPPTTARSLRRQAELSGEPRPALGAGPSVGPGRCARSADRPRPWAATVVPARVGVGQARPSSRGGSGRPPSCPAASRASRVALPAALLLVARRGPPVSSAAPPPCSAASLMRVSSPRHGSRAAYPASGRGACAVPGLAARSRYRAPDHDLADVAGRWPADRMSARAALAPCCSSRWGARGGGHRRHGGHGRGHRAGGVGLRGRGVAAVLAGRPQRGRGAAPPVIHAGERGARGRSYVPGGAGLQVRTAGGGAARVLYEDVYRDGF